MTKTIYLTDAQLERLYNGTSVRAGDVLITFAEGSKRDCTKKAQLERDLKEAEEVAVFNAAADAEGDAENDEI